MIEVEVQDAERLVVDYLDPLIGDEFTCGIGIPSDWTPEDSPAHLGVLSDGEPENVWPVLVHNTIRLIACAKTMTEAKSLCALGLRFLMAHPGGRGICGCVLLTGVFPDVDQVTKYQTASATVRVTVRTVQVS